MCYVPLSIIGYVGVVDHLHFVGARDALGVWLWWMMSNSLAESPNFVCVGLVPLVIVFWVSSELPVVECFSAAVV